jgi:hypothetical protein
MRRSLREVVQSALEKGRRGLIGADSFTGKVNERREWVGEMARLLEKLLSFVIVRLRSGVKYLGAGIKAKRSLEASKQRALQFQSFFIFTVCVLENVFAESND